MKVYTKIVYDKDDNIIEEHSYNYNGPVSQARPIRMVNGKIVGPKYFINKKIRAAKNKAHDALADAKLIALGKKWAPVEVGHTGNLGGSDHMDVNFEDLNKTRKTFVTDISDPNRLFKYASYNSLFTLSALRQGDLEDVKTLLNTVPHDIVIRSGGIGPGDTRYTNQDTDNPNEQKNAGGLSSKNKKILDRNETMKASLERSQVEFGQNNDMYFKNVEMLAIPGPNEERKLTSVTKIKMEIVEPWGITLLERLKAAAANNDYLDHLDAPFLLTIEFAGWDEHGKAIPPDAGKNLKRVIPIKLINMELDVNQGGTIYTVTAIPYNEFAYVDRYNTVRTSGTIIPKDKTFASIANELENILNKQVKDEHHHGLTSIPDKYYITIDDSFNPTNTKVDVDALEQTAMFEQSHEVGFGEGQVDPALAKAAGVDTTFAVESGKDYGPYRANVSTEYMKFSSGMRITKILEDIMKTHPTVTDDKFKEWKSIVKRKLGAEQYRTKSAQSVYEASKGEEMHFPYFRIRSSVIPTSEFDEKRKTNVKKIYYVIEPYKIHAYSLAIPGVSTGQNFKSFVHKTYNYIFTGENVDILDLNISYKVAYFTSQLKNVPSGKKNKSGEKESEKTSGSTAQDDPQDQTFLLRGEVGLAQSGGTGLTGQNTTAIDQFLDYLTHPKADMVFIRMEILGDPAWLSQSQFIPANPFTVAPGSSEDKATDVFRANRNYLWNDKLGCYNADIAEPIILLNYRMPTDINDKKGTYELQNTKSASFSGLYRVVQIDHMFVDGKYTNMLHMVRFNNQGISISKPYTEYKVYQKNGETFVGTDTEITSLIKKGFSIDNVFDMAKTKIKNKVKKVVNKTLNNITRGFY